MAVEAELYNGDFACFDIVQEQLQMLTWQQQQQQQQQRFQFQSFDCYQNGAYGADVATMGFTQSVTSLLEKHKQELDWALQIQYERLRTTIQESSTRQLAILLHNSEPYITALLSPKDEIISMANEKKSMLENHVRDIQTEIATWRVKARESEARIRELNNALREKNNSRDEESRCDSGSTTCQVCKARRSCAVFMPCRHLCSCEFCEEFVDVCPVCASVKESSVEVLFD